MSTFISTCFLPIVKLFIKLKTDLPTQPPDPKHTGRAILLYKKNAQCKLVIPSIFKLIKSSNPHTMLLFLNNNMLVETTGRVAIHIINCVKSFGTISHVIINETSGQLYSLITFKTKIENPRVGISTAKSTELVHDSKHIIVYDYRATTNYTLPENATSLWVKDFKNMYFKNYTQERNGLLTILNFENAQDCLFVLKKLKQQNKKFGIIDRFIF